MSCFDAERIYSYIEGELDPAGREEFERHLGVCPACRRAVDERRLVVETAAALPPLEMPADFSRRVLARIPDRTRVSVFGWLALGSTAFVSLLAVAVGLLALSGRSLVQIVAGVEGLIVGTFKQGAVLFGKASSLVALVLRVAGQLLSALWEGLSSIASVFPWPVCAAGLVVLALIVATSIFGLRRILVGVRS